MADDEVGSASIKITPDLSGFEEDLKAGVDEATAGDDGDVHIGLKLDDDGFKEQLAADEAAASGVGDHVGSWDSFDLPPEEEESWQRLSAAMEKAGVDADNFTDKMEEAGVSEQDLTNFADKANVQLDDLVSHLDNAGTSSKSLLQDFQMATTSFDDLGDHAKNTTDSMATLDEHAKSLSAGLELAASSSEAAGQGFDQMSRAAENSGEGMSGLITAAVTLGPALIPLAGAATAAVIGLGGAFLAAGLGIGAFALAAQPELADLKAQATDLLSSFQNLVAPDVLPVLNGSIGLLKDALQSAVPLVGTTSDALQTLEDRAEKAMDSPAWRDFTTFIDAEAGPAITSFGHDLGNLGAGFGTLLETFAPVETEMEDGLEHLTASFKNWASATGGSQQFLQWFQTNGPEIGQVFKNLASVAGDLLTAFGGYGEVLIRVLNPTLELVNDLLKINPLVADVAVGVLAMGVAWAKFGDTIGNVISDFTHFSSIADNLGQSETGIGKLAANISNLGPVAQQATTSMDTLSAAQVKVLGTAEEAAAAEQREAAAAQEDAAAQTELAGASDEAAIAQGDLAGAADTAAVSHGVLGTAAKDAAPEIEKVGETAGETAIGVGGAETAATLFGASLDSLAIPVAGVGIGLGIMLTALLITGQTTALADAGVRQLVAGMDSANQTTLPNMTAALDHNREMVSSLTGEMNKYANANAQASADTNAQATSLGVVNGQYKETAGGAGIAGDATGNMTKQLQAAEAQEQKNSAATKETGASYTDASAKVREYSTAIGLIQDADTKLAADQKTAKSNIDEFSTALGITKSAAEDLAQQLGFNLAKAFTGTQITQGAEQLKEWASAAGISESALEELSKSSGVSMAAISSAATAAGKATQQALSTAQDAVTALGTQTTQTAGNLLSFYQNQETSASAFSTNIQAALKDGYSPALINQILQQGPAASAMLQQMVNDAQGSYAKDTSNAAAALATANKAIVENSSLTSEAVTSHDSAMLAQLPEIAAIENAKVQAALTGNSQAAIATLNAQYPNWAAVATKYSVALPTAFKDSGPATETAAAAQGKLASTGTLTGLLAQASAANQLAQEMPSAATKATAATADAYYNQAVAAASGVTKGNPAVQNAATAPATALSTKAKSDAGNSQAAGSQQGQSLFDGINSKAATVFQVADTIGQQVKQRAQANTPPTRQAGEDQGTALGGGLFGSLGSVNQVADQLGSASHTKINSHVGDNTTAGKAQGDAANSGLQGTQGEIESTAENIGTQISEKIRDGTSSHEGQIASTLLSTVKSAISSTAADAGGQSVGEAMDNGVVQGIQQHEGAISSALLGAVKQAIGNAAADAGGQSVGAALDDGIAAGINGNSGIVSSAAATVVNNAKAAANAAANTKSPSQVFRDEVGLPIAQGLALGILDGQNQVENSARALIGAGLSAIKGTGSNSAVAISTSFGTQVGQQAASAITAATPISGPITINAPVTFNGTGKDDAAKFQKLLDANNQKLIQLIGAR